MNHQSPLALKPHEKLLIYGIGNVGRQDDGLGIRLIEQLEQISLPSFVHLEANYQLNIEDALFISKYDVVLFVDASKESDKISPFSIRPIQAAFQIQFSTHAISMEEVCSLCETLYQRKPRAFLLALPGYQWEINEKLSPPGEAHLYEALKFLKEALGVQ